MLTADVKPVKAVKQAKIHVETLTISDLRPSESSEGSF